MIINPGNLINKVIEKTGINILAKDRSKTKVLIRQAICYHLRQNSFSTPEIGKILGQDHSTIIHALKKIDLKKNEYIKLVKELI